MGPRWMGDCIPPLTGRIKCDNEHCEWQWRRLFQSLQTLGGSHCFSDEWTSASAPHERQNKLRRSGGGVGGRRGTVVHLRLIKTSEASRRLWSRLIKGLKRGDVEGCLCLVCSFFLSLHVVALKSHQMKAACQHGATQVARAANFAHGTISLFYFSQREMSVAPFSKGSHDYTAVFTMLLQPLLDLSAAIHSQCG